MARAALGSFGLSVLNTVANTILTIILARAMGLSDYGLYAFVVATVTLLGVPAILGVDRLTTRDIAVHTSQGEYGLARGLIRRGRQLVLGVSSVIVVVGIGLAWLVAGGDLSVAVLAFWVGLLALPFLALLRVTQAVLMGFGKVVLGQSPEFLVRPMAFLALLVLAIAYLGPQVDPILAVAMHSASIAAACVVAAAFLHSRMPARVASAGIAFLTRPWVLGALSLAVLSGTAIVNSQAGVTLLGAMASKESAGLFAVAQRGALLVAFPLAAVGTAIAPRAARLWAVDQREHLQSLISFGARGVLLGSLPIALLFIVFPRELLTLLFGAAYADADVALAILAVGQLLNAATGPAAVLLVMTANQRRAAIGIALGAVLNIGLAVLLIPSFDVAGAAVASAASIVFSNVLLVILVRRSLGLDATALGRPLVRPRDSLQP